MFFAIQPHLRYLMSFYTSMSSHRPDMMRYHSSGDFENKGQTLHIIAGFFEAVCGQNTTKLVRLYKGQAS